MGIGNDSDFAIIHWRAEIPNMNYMECAERIVNAKDAMLLSSPKNAPRFLLMSSLSTSNSTGMQWGGAQAMAPNATAQRALQYLMNDHGFSKIDQVFDQLDIHDWIIAAALDLILAQKATHFATCTRDCKGSWPNRDCLNCNHAGSFALTALQMRAAYTNITTNATTTTNTTGTSYPCWPVSMPIVDTTVLV
jgi:hypothetical protein